MPPLTVNMMEATKPKTTRRKARQFPFRLHDMLDDAQRRGFDHIVRWLPDGSGFQIVQPKQMLPILQHYGFVLTRWKSFLRQLQNYGFHRELRGVNKGYCCHRLFRRGQRDLCRDMVHEKKVQSFEFLDNLASKPMRSFSSAPSPLTRYETPSSKDQVFSQDVKLDQRSDSSDSLVRERINYLLMSLNHAKGQYCNEQEFKVPATSTVFSGILEETSQLFRNSALALESQSSFARDPTSKMDPLDSCLDEIQPDEDASQNMWKLFVEEEPLQAF